MSTETNEPQGTAAPAPAPAQPQQPVQPSEPAWLPERLNQAKASGAKSLLEQLGAKDAAEVKTRLQRLAALEQQQMTEAEKTAARIKELEDTNAKLTPANAALKQLVDSQFGALSERQQSAIDAVANGDPLQRLALMNVMKAGLEGVTQQNPAPASSGITPIPKANTLPENAPRPPANPAQSKTKFEVWREKVGQDPMAASIFYRANSVEIENSRPSQ